MAGAIQQCLNTKLRNEPQATRDAIRKLMVAILEKPPNKGFQLTLLKHVCHDHFVFSKGYVKPKPQKQVDPDWQLDDPHGFFAGLPLAPEVKRKRVPGITQQMRLEKKKKALEAAHAHL